METTPLPPERPDLEALHLLGRHPDGLDLDTFTTTLGPDGWTVWKTVRGAGWITVDAAGRIHLSPEGQAQLGEGY